MPKVPVEDLRDEDMVDILPLLDDPDAYGWDWGAGYDPDLAGARMIAESDYAQVDGEAKPSNSHPGRVELGTTQMNFTLPPGYLIERVDS